MEEQFGDRLKRVTIGDPTDHRDIVVTDYDPAWPQRFREEAAKIRAALHGRVVRLEHIGSTAVPGLPAKPIIDVLLVVEDSSDEESYLPALQDAGYELRVREPDFEEHRMLRTPARDVHLHVFSSGSRAITRYLLFRDRLRRDEDDRQRYAAVKRDLARRDWPTMQHYAEAKTDIIDEIVVRAAGETPTNDYP